MKSLFIITSFLSLIFISYLFKQVANPTSKYFVTTYKIQPRVSDSINNIPLFQSANTFFVKKDWKSFLIITNKILSKSIAKKDTSSLAKAYRYKAEYYKEKFNNDSSFYFYLKAERLYSKINDKINLGKTIYKRGIIQFYGGDYLGADLAITQSFNLLKNYSDKQLVYQILSMMGVISNELEDYNRAIEFHTKALNLIDEFNLNSDLNQKATTLNNLGNVYQRLNKNREAINIFKMALNSKEGLKSMPDLYARLLDNYAYSKLKINDITEITRLFFEALRIRDSLGQSSGIVTSKLHISDYYLHIKDTVTSLRYVNEALILARISKTPSDILVSLKQLSLVDRENASAYSKYYIQLSDSLQQIERKSRDKFTRQQLETNDIIQQKDKLEEQNRSLFYFFLGTILIGLLLFIIRAQRSKNRELVFLQAQQKANEEIYNLMITQQQIIEENRVLEKRRIAQELHDGILGRLFGARLNLDSLNKSESPNDIVKRFGYLEELKNIEQDIREISHDLSREKNILVNNFVSIVSELLAEQKTSFVPDLKYWIDTEIKWENVRNSVKINLYRIIQESLQNINKYAQASEIMINVVKKDATVHLVIEDNGIGFDLNSKKKGIGLQNIFSRVKECSGNCKIDSSKGGGTKIEISLPLED